MIKTEAFQNQLLQDENFHNDLWKKVVNQKMLNQAYILDSYDVYHTLHKLIEKPLASEANVSRQFWQKYFVLLGESQTREYQNANSFENKALNYGYAVIASLIHRSILIHGLLPNLGIHHKERYRSAPLVYDLEEPLRGFVELALIDFCNQYEEEDRDYYFNEWIRLLSIQLRQRRIDISKSKQTLKLMDAIDYYINSVVRCFENMDTENLWLPSLKESYIHKEKDEEG